MSWSDQPLKKEWLDYDLDYLANIAWVEQNLFVPSGSGVGEPVRLRWFQRMAFRALYSKKTPCRRLIYSVGRKNGKSALTACILLLHLVGPEAGKRRNAEYYSTAQSREQASIVFELAKKMILMSPSLSNVLTITDSAKKIENKELGLSYRALSADANTAYGLSPALAIHDELGQVRGPKGELYSAVETAMGAYDNPLSIVISTQAADDSSLLSVLIDDAKKGNDPQTKLILFTAPDDCDPFSEEAVKLANPALGDFQNKAEVMGMADNARRMPAQESSFRNLNLNQRVDSYDPFISRQIWIQSGEHGRFTGPCFGGLDLSEVNDLTALVLVFPQDNPWSVKSYFWLPKFGIVEKSKKDRVTYDVWEKQGHLLTTPGKSIEYEYVAQQIAELFDQYDIKKIGFDRWNMRHLKPWLSKSGLSEGLIDERFAEFGQGYVSMSPALRVLEAKLLNAKLAHGNHPVLTMCAGNAVVKTNEAGDRKLDKAKSRGRIDGLVSLAMACSLADQAYGKKSLFDPDLIEAAAVD